MNCCTDGPQSETHGQMNTINAEMRAEAQLSDSICSSSLVTEQAEFDGIPVTVVEMSQSSQMNLQKLCSTSKSHPRMVHEE